MRDAAVAIALFVSLLPNQQAVFRSQTEEVRIDVLVTDGRRPVGGLTARNFELLDAVLLRRSNRSTSRNCRSACSSCSTRAPAWKAPRCGSSRMEPVRLSTLYGRAIAHRS